MQFYEAAGIVCAQEILENLTLHAGQICILTILTKMFAQTDKFSIDLKPAKDIALSRPIRCQHNRYEMHEEAEKLFMSIESS